VLKEHRARQAEERLTAGPAWIGGDDYVFTTGWDLRHIHATTLLLAGVPVHVVAARLGHADPSVTLRVYAHVIREQVAAAADIFARSIPAGESPAVSKSVSKRALTERRKGL
jgi:integrase